LAKLQAEIPVLPWAGDCHGLMGGFGDCDESPGPVGIIRRFLNGYQIKRKRAKRAIMS